MSISVLGIAGSLRAGSFNRGLIRAAAELAPAGMEVHLFERFAEIPLFNEDVEAKGDPEPVVAFKTAIRAADALLIATPEYNYSIPGVLKNAIDWASRPAANSVLAGKPAAIVGATPGPQGTARAQTVLRQSFVFTQTCAMLRPELYLPRAHEKFDAQGRLTDEPTREQLRKVLQALAEWVARFGS
jgi:chromate reductase